MRSLLPGRDPVRLLLGGMERIDRLDKPPRTHAELVHALRVRSKRLRALLELTRDGLANAFYQSEKCLVRRAARRLSGTRDSAVIRHEIAVCIRSLPEGKRRKARSFCRALHDEASSKIQENTLVQESERELKYALERFASAPGRPIQLGLPLNRSFRCARSGMCASRKMRRPKSFHYWRKWTKRLQLEVLLLKAAGLLHGSQLYHDLDTLQQKLGRHRDLLLAEKYLSGGKAPKALVKIVRYNRRKLEKKVLCSGRKIFNTKPAKFLAKLSRGAGAKSRRCRSKIPPMQEQNPLNARQATHRTSGGSVL